MNLSEAIIRFNSAKERERELAILQDIADSLTAGLELLNNAPAQAWEHVIKQFIFPYLPAHVTVIEFQEPTKRVFQRGNSSSKYEGQVSLKFNSDDSRQQSTWNLELVTLYARQLNELVSQAKKVRI